MLNYNGIPRWKNVKSTEFSNHIWQEANSVRNAHQLQEVLLDSTPPNMLKEINKGLELAPMVSRATPYLISLIDWDNWINDPIRRQFIPIESEMEPDHPMSVLDPMGEQKDSPTPGLVHRYPDKALFLVTHVCPVYCRYCTRGYAIGTDTDTVSKQSLGPTRARIESVIRYLEKNSDIEDVVISGGDAFRLQPEVLTKVCSELLNIPHIRRIRIATKGLAVLPMKITSDHGWTNAIIDLADQARRLLKQFSIQTHFNHPKEITGYTTEAMKILFSAGVQVRNQSVLLRRVNDSDEVMLTLIKMLSDINIQPYYVYVGDMTRGAEDLRTSLDVAISIEKSIRGRTAGYNIPTFVVDLPEGGGKRDVHSYESYDRERGIATFKSPVISNSREYRYYDPISYLSKQGKSYWNFTAK